MWLNSLLSIKDAAVNWFSFYLSCTSQPFYVQIGNSSDSNSLQTIRRAGFHKVHPRVLYVLAGSLCCIFNTCFYTFRSYLSIISGAHTCSYQSMSSSHKQLKNVPNYAACFLQMCALEFTIRSLKCIILLHQVLFFKRHNVHK